MLKIHSNMSDWISGLGPFLFLFVNIWECTVSPFEMDFKRMAAYL